ncbi:hypothetical protein HNY73_011569 [Argiope bruennichi]|uniref:Uncharacterized protein n=1 Tax=Argiope bruennichi TaxID=94029 RepID=A0A8T0F149_ARGBR|nr:hypothetical protein HNY73_011569 [Argiope bruennichi]
MRTVLTAKIAHVLDLPKCARLTAKMRTVVTAKMRTVLTAKCAPVLLPKCGTLLDLPNAQPSDCQKAHRP